MNAQEKLGKILDEIQNEKDIEISRLRDENERLRQENERLKQLKGPDLLISNPNPNQCRIKAIELKKAIEDYLSDGRPNIRTNANVSISSSYPPITGLHSNVEVNKSTNENPKNYRQVVDESATNGMSRHGINSFREEFNYGNQQQTRPEDDTDIVNEATGMQQPRNNYYPTSLPTVVNNTNGRRFNNNVNMGGGMNNNNNRNRNNSNHNTHLSHHNNNNNNNYNNKQNQLTIFVSWSGKMTTEELNELFDVNEIDEIRYTNQKQFAHIDLKTENALNKALELDGKTKNQNQGLLRVEKGKPRSSNPSENGQRAQHQNKNHNRQNNNNKNPNGYNLQKHNNNNKPYYPNNNNGHNPQYSFTPEDNKSFSIPNGSNGLSSSLSQQQEHNKSDSS